MEKRPFAELGLSPEVLKAVDKMGFEEASPIQTAVIPLLLAGRDVVGQSSTGSGKTAAFAIPAIERVDPNDRSVQALILCPTRELAVQVAEEFGKLGYFKRGLQAVPIYGGQSYDRQFRALEAGAQIVIGTPGRVMDHMSRGTLRLDKLKMLALDEADRMLDLGFREDIQHILDSTPKQRQLLFFSATMPSAIRELINQHSTDPEWVRIESIAQNAPQVEQVYYEVDRRYKVELLTRLIDLHDFRYGIIFCSTKVMVDDLDEHLHSRGYNTDRLHGDISQAQRDRVMQKFRARGFEFLVATDVAARGLDVDDLEVVFNYDLPNDAEDYTHRIGRTGRAGRTGMAFTFVAGRELYKLQSMVRYARLRIRRENVPSLDQVEEARENVFIGKLRAALEAKEFISQDRIIDGLMEEGFASTDIASALIHMLQGNTTAKASTSPAKSFANSPSSPAASPAASARSTTARQNADESDEDRPPVHTPAPSSKPAIFKPTPKKPALASPTLAKAEPAEAEEAPVETPKPAAKAPKHVAKEAPALEVGDADEAHAPKPLHPKRAEKFERKGHTGEEGYTTVRLNLGSEHAVSVGEIVGKIAGVTRLPANIIGAVAVHDKFTLVDVLNEHSPLVLAKLIGVRMKGQLLKPSEHKA